MADVFLLISISILILFYARVIHFIKIPYWLLISALFCFISVLGSLSDSDDLALDISWSLKTFFSMFIFPIFLSNFIKDTYLLNITIKFWIISVFLNTGTVILNFFNVTSFSAVSIQDPEILTGTVLGRYNGLSNNANDLATSCLLVQPLIFNLIFTSDIKKIFTKIWYIFILSVNYIAVILSASRSGIIGTVLIFIIFLYRVLHIKFIFVFVFIFIFLYAFTSGNLSNFNTYIPSEFTFSFNRLIGEDENAKISSNIRLLKYNKAINEFVCNPFFGAGFRYIATAHNIYLQLLQSGGVCLFISFIIFIGGIFKTILRITRRKDVDVKVINISKALFITIVVWLCVIGLLGNCIYSRFLYIPVGLLVSVGYSKRLAFIKEVKYQLSKV